MPHQQPQLRTIPAKARRFAAQFEVGSNGDNAKTAPVKLVARSSEPVDVPCWGRVAHDLAGMSLVKPRIPLDYCHDDYAIIGYANNFDTATGDLVAGGALVPYSQDPNDKASEVLYKSQNGIPYEASIFFTGPLVIEEVDAGATTFVNGKQMEGPLTVIRQWTLRGIAICPHGVDPFTDAQMKTKFSDSGDIEAVVIKDVIKETKMSETAEVVQTTVEATTTTMDARTELATTTEAQAVEVEPAKTTDEATPVAVDPNVVMTMSQTAEGTQSPTAAPVEAKTEGQKFLAAFGDKGGVWFAEGKTFEAAQALFMSEVVAQRNQLAKDVEDLKQKLAATRGESSPLSFSADPKEVGPGTAVAIDPKVAQNLGPGLAKLAANMKFKN